MEDKELAKVLQNSQLIIQDLQGIIKGLLDERKVNKNEIAELKIDTEVYRRLKNSDGTVDMGVVAQMLRFKRLDSNKLLGKYKLFEALRKIDILHYVGNENVPYQRYLDGGYFEVKIVPREYGNYIFEVYKTVVTVKGIDYIAKKLREAGYEYAN